MLFGLDPSASSGQALILQDDGTETRILLADGLGSSRMEMVGSQVETTTTYEPYGKLLAESGSSGTVYGYTGEAHDASANLVFLRARYYNPYLNQFLSRDPFPGYATLSISQNGYTYVHANPINKVDPTGLCAENGNEACWSIYDRLVAKNPELANVPVLPLLSESELRQLEQLYGNIPEGGYYHTENYGSFDYKHIHGTNKSYDIIQEVQTAIGLPAGYMFRVRGDLLARIKRGLATYEAWYWVSGDVKQEQVVGVALAIQMDWERRWETMQGRTILGNTSYYATEDLPSDYVGFYLATQGFEKANSYSMAVAFAQLGDFDHSNHAAPWIGKIDNLDNWMDLNDSFDIGLLRNYQFMPMVDNGICGRHNIAWPSNMQIEPIPSVSGLWKFVEDLAEGTVGLLIGDLD